MGLAAGRRDLGDRRIQPLAIGIDGGDAAALAPDDVGGGAADAARRCRDERDLALEPHRAPPSLVPWLSVASCSQQPPGGRGTDASWWPCSTPAALAAGHGSGQRPWYAHACAPQLPGIALLSHRETAQEQGRQRCRRSRSATSPSPASSSATARGGSPRTCSRPTTRPPASAISPRWTRSCSTRPRARWSSPTRPSWCARRSTRS